VLSAALPTATATANLTRRSQRANTRKSPKDIAKRQNKTFPNDLVLKVLHAAETPAATAAALNRTLQHAVLVEDPRQLSLTMDLANAAQFGSGLAKITWLSRPKDKCSADPYRTGPLRLVLKSSGDNVSNNSGYMYYSYQRYARQIADAAPA
jgi:hypothetical protein